MLVKAVANATTASFIRVVGSEFVQKYLGEGPRMVRDVFRLARENAPAIIFIDEIDAIATKRFDAQTGADREVQRILLELLNQMDGFDQGSNVKVIMATNRADTLDPALLRPGRLDRKIEFPLPSRREKRLIFQTITSKMNLSPDVDLEDYVSRPDKLSSAEIASICQAAGLKAVRSTRYVIIPADFEEWVALFTIALDFESCVLTLSSAQRLEAGRQAERRQQDGVLPVIWLGLACIVADEEQDEVAELSRKLQAAQLSDEARKVCDRELKRLQRIPPQSVERGVVITYLETMAELPWDNTSADLDELAAETRAVATTTKDTAVVENDDEEGIVGRARRILDEDHYGLDKIKKRLVEYLAVLELKTEQAKERLEEKERQANEAAGQAKRSAASANQRNKVEAAKKQQQQQQQIDLEGDSASEDSQIGHLEERGQDEESDNNKRKEAEERRKGKKRAAVADKGPILLLVGPPGTGKTSIARSLASALRRPFTRLSLGGVRDESEIRGHRRTYVGAMPGSIASSLRKVGVSDPVMLLDEVDKLGSGNGLHGDPMAAMLEVLDPEQNFQFMDHYVNCPIDLSRVLFIATANTLETISPPLLDRTEVIHVSGYTHDEKVAIAKQYLLPKQAKAQGLRPGVDIKVDDDVLLKIAMSYTREAGVRSLEREIGAVARGKAVQFSEARKGQLKDKKTGNKIDYDPNVRLEHLEDLLGVETFDPEVAEREARPGVATGLAYQGSGSGGILHIESLLLPPGNSSLKLTGKLGDVIRESAELSLSWVKAHSFQLGIVSERSSEFPKHDIHLHLPGGAIPKDGPSAGMAMTLALVSLFTRIPIDTKLAMTGEMTLRGQVTPVGGIKEKCLGAHRAGIRRLILPLRNRKDVEADLPKQIRDELNISYVRTIWQAIEIAFGQRALLESALKGGTGNLEGIEEGRRMMELEEARL
ncbi:hypothetical protein L7F22_052255 [Adiantum nelumboides]|nr:hypothetical protein [Adiantum nelumboides]